MKYYETQLDDKQTQDFLISELNKGINHFSKAEVIPIKKETWAHGYSIQMPVLFRVNGSYYLAGLYTKIIRRYEAERVQAPYLYERQVKVQQLADLELSNILSDEVFIGPDVQKQVVYQGTKIYCCRNPKSRRQGLLEDYESSFWYFTEPDIPSQILEKVSQRSINDFSNVPLMTIKLKHSPFKGFKRDVIYKRYTNSRWTLTNRNGREAEKYELTIQSRKEIKMKIYSLLVFNQEIWDQQTDLVGTYSSLAEAIDAYKRFIVSQVDKAKLAEFYEDVVQEVVNQRVSEFYELTNSLVIAKSDLDQRVNYYADDSFVELDLRAIYRDAVNNYDYYAEKQPS